jgi:hypothetical protein
LLVWLLELRPSSTHLKTVWDKSKDPATWKQ